jgi:flagellin-specific chaperone FliS
MPEWMVSTPSPSTAALVAYTVNQIVIYDGVAYKANANITQIENTDIPENNDKFDKISLLFQNLKTGVQYRWGSDGQWMKSFEGEYASGYWRFDLDPV